jgi:hypothetical protein
MALRLEPPDRMTVSGGPVHGLDRYQRAGGINLDPKNLFA